MNNWENYYKNRSKKVSTSVKVGWAAIAPGFVVVNAPTALANLTIFSAI